MTPPFVPRGTRFQGAVIRNGVEVARIPSSELKVSEATAAYCATMPRGRILTRDGKYGPGESWRCEEVKGVLVKR